MDIQFFYQTRNSLTIRVTISISLKTWLNHISQSREKDYEDSVKSPDISTQININSLECISNWIVTVKKKNIRNLLEVAWLAILEDCSNRKKDGNGLVTRLSSVSDVYTHFKNQVFLMLSDLQKHPLPRDAYAKAYNQSAIEMKKASHPLLRKKDMGAIIYSPPYANSFDYFESYKIELILGNFFRFSELKNARKSLIRNYRLNNSEVVSMTFNLVEGLCSEIFRFNTP